MSDPIPPSDATAEPEIPAEPPPRRPARYRRERTAVGAVFFAITGAVIINGAIAIHRDTFRGPSAAAPWSRCSDGIDALYAAFSARLGTSAAGAPHRPASGAELATLDDQLVALRPLCDAEGSAAREAYGSLTLWRHRAEDLSRLEARALLPDAERALRYRSPGGAAPPAAAPPTLLPGNDR